MARKGHFRRSGLIYCVAKNSWNIHTRTTKCTVLLAECLAYSVVKKKGKRTGYQLVWQKVFWKDSVKHICEHAATQYLMSSIVAFKSYLQNKLIKCLQDQQRAAEQSRRQREIASNWQVLAHLLDIIRLLAKQNLALRGHNESASSLNRENFWIWSIIKLSKQGKMPLVTWYLESAYLCNSQQGSGKYIGGGERRQVLFQYY